MAANIIQPTVINQAWANANRQDPSLRYTVESYGKTAYGALRIFQAIKKPLDLGSELVKRIGGTPAPALTHLSRNLGTGIAALGIPHLYDASIEAFRCVEAMQKDDGVDFTRKAVKAVKESAEIVSTAGYVTMFVTGNPALKTATATVEMTGDIADLHLSYADYSRASELEAQATGDAKAALQHSKIYYFLRVAKAVGAIAGAILGFALVATGSTLLGLLILSLATTFVAIARDLYKPMGHYPVINFDREVRLA